MNASSFTIQPSIQSQYKTSQFKLTIQKISFPKHHKTIEVLNSAGTISIGSREKTTKSQMGMPKGSDAFLPVSLLSLATSHSSTFPYTITRHPLKLLNLLIY